MAEATLGKGKTSKSDVTSVLKLGQKVFVAIHAQAMSEYSTGDYIFRHVQVLLHEGDKVACIYDTDQGSRVFVVHVAQVFESVDQAPAVEEMRRRLKEITG